MINSAGSNSMMASSSSTSGNNAQSPGLKTHFKTPEGRYKLHYDKTYPTGYTQYGQTQSQAKTFTQATLAHLKDKPMQSQSQSSFGGSSGVRSAAARLLGGGNGTKSLSFVGANGGSKSVSGMSTRIGSLGASSTNHYVGNSNFDGKGNYLVFNFGEDIFICDLNSRDKDPIKSLHFSSNPPVCHAFDPEAKDSHDLLIGLASGDVYLVSLRQQLQEIGKKLVGAQHYNKDGSVNSTRCTTIAWVPNSDGTFVVGHADGSFYVYDKSKDSSSDPSFPAIKDQTQFSVSHARNSKNPVARWHILQGSINSIAFSTDGAYIATVGRDGYLRVFDYRNEQLVCGGKGYYGALLCCAWSMDGKYILTGGEDDLVQVWSMEERKVVAWGEGHNSWVSGVSFDSYWSTPNSDGTGENIVYRFGSVGQDTQLLLWDLEMDEIVVPMRRPSGGSPTFSTGSQSAHWDTACPMGTLHPAPSMRDVPKLSPLVAHHVHTEPLSGLIFTHESVLTICREGHIKVWTRPGSGESSTSNSGSLLSTSLKEKQSISSKAVSSSFKQ
nr:WD repeat-containing protein 20-like [Ipomoea trifida]GMC50949.1 WD repeat-containing protein 20-like [Ipomoea batatas]